MRAIALALAIVAVSAWSLQGHTRPIAMTPKAAAGNAFMVSLSGNTISASVSIVGTEDMGAGLDRVLLRCELFNGSTGLVSPIGAGTSAISVRWDVPRARALVVARLSDRAGAQGIGAWLVDFTPAPGEAW